MLLDALGMRALGWESDEFSEKEQGLTRAWLMSFAQTLPAVHPRCS